MSVSSILIGEKRIGRDSPCFVIAEAGINHNGDISIAKDLIRAASNAGCDAVKFQTYRTEALASAEAPMADYQRANTGYSGPQSAILKRCELNRRAHEQLLAECLDAGILFLSTPFDNQSLDLLIELGVQALKVSSGDLTNTPFLDRVSATCLPVIASTGMATMQDVEDAVAILRSASCGFALLHCVSCYPAAPEECRLSAIKELESSFRVPVGFSDHTTGYDITIAAIAAGATIIEKHITTNRSLPGPDHAASIEPHELKAMMVAIRRVEAALAGGKTPSEREKRTAIVARKSLHFSAALPAGSVLKQEHLVAMRPGTGLVPSRLRSFVGRRLTTSVPAGAMLEEGMVE
jgi:N,N'-diacetyllegionaminate synthase